MPKVSGVTGASNKASSKQITGFEGCSSSSHASFNCNTSGPYTGKNEHKHPEMNTADVSWPTKRHVFFAFRPFLRASQSHVLKELLEKSDLARRAGHHVHSLALLRRVGHVDEGVAHLHHVRWIRILSAPDLSSPGHGAFVSSEMEICMCPDMPKRFSEGVSEQAETLETSSIGAMVIIGPSWAYLSRARRQIAFQIERQRTWDCPRAQPSFPNSSSVPQNSTSKLIRAHKTGLELISLRLLSHIIHLSATDRLVKLGSHHLWHLRRLPRPRSFLT